MPDQRLARNAEEQIFAGVAAGIAKRLGVGAIGIRMVFILLSLFPPFPGVLLYLFLWIFMPADRTAGLESATSLTSPPRREPLGRTKRFLSIFNSGIGVLNGLLVAAVGVWGLAEPFAEFERRLGTSGSLPVTTSIPTASEHLSTSGSLPNLQSLEEERVKSAVLAASRAEMAAFASLDLSPLSGLVGESMLTRYRGEIEGLRRDGVFLANQLLGQEFGQIRISPDGLTAEADLIEQWSTEILRLGDRACVARIPPHEVRQTAQLVRNASGWLLNQVSFDSTSPQAQAC